ncbi:DUF4352 domain-containing protein [Streptococcus dysgalactiae]|uniref:hypothetical protein n=1 Tax=Streptococcus dysgalactiae TaxID=1334 RepID=UPI000617B2C1|nr:hypothetical protein [Streptococcus dysgalactiae]KKC16775.1 hypothetical protein WH81_07760 [Streptococcus dysgalactiae subsp. equisimilis]VTT09692.1 Telomeric repeat-binding factor 2 [Streptococcus dysgalactiae subsp. equisimilis]
MKKLVTLGATVLSILFLVACSNNSQPKTATKQTTTKEVVTNKTENKTPKNQKYKIGDKLTFNNGLEITVTNAEFTDERNEFDETNPEKVLKVTYNVVNNTDKEYLVSSEMELYVGNKKMETYPITSTTETLSPGRSYENAVTGFGVNGNEKMELEVKPTFSMSNEKFVVELDLQ